MNIGIFVFPVVEILDFAGPYEVFTTAARMHARAHPAASPLFKVFTIAERREALAARADFPVQPDFAINDHPPLDLLIVAGGVVDQPLGSRAVIDWIGAEATRCRIVASVCTGAFLLAEAGLLKGRRATTHWEDIPDLRARHPGISIIENTRWIDEGAIVTSAGISAGIDMSLHLVSRLADMELAIRTARQMEFDWSRA